MSLPTELHILILTFFNNSQVLEDSILRKSSRQDRLRPRLICRRFYNLIPAQTGLMSLPSELYILTFIPPIVGVLKHGDMMSVGLECRFRLRLTCRYFYTLIASPTLDNRRLFEHFYRSGNSEGLRFGLGTKSSGMKRLSKFSANEQQKPAFTSVLPVGISIISLPR